MTASHIALLLGLFVAPAILLYSGHHLRDRSPRGKRRFWGGVVGHIAGMLVAAAAMMGPPVWWEGGGAFREFAVYWSMLIGFLAGKLIGWSLPPRESLPENRPAA